MASKQETQQYAVSLKLPGFWTIHPRVWFQQTEAQFVLRQITADNMKYFYVVAALDQDFAQKVSDVLEYSPSNHIQWQFMVEFAGGTASHFLIFLHPL